VGGGIGPMPGEATLAHHGVLFLDELSEFHRGTLEALRQPLEDGRVTIVRGQRVAVFPTRAMVVAATNPCPCGFAGDEQRCRCTETDHARHRRRLSGPLLDRIDLVVGVERPSAAALAAGPASSTAAVRDAVLGARERQAHRLTGTTAHCNAQMAPAQLRRCAALDAQGRAALACAYERDFVSPRGHDRILRVARTIADLRGAERVAADDVLLAINLRTLEHPADALAA
jgi:magnesium chelatase family protein